MVTKLQTFTIKIFLRQGSNHTYLAAISLDSSLKKDGIYYLQLFSKECKHVVEKVIRHVHDDLSDFSDSSNEK